KNPSCSARLIAGVIWLVVCQLSANVGANTSHAPAAAASQAAKPPTTRLRAGLSMVPAMMMTMAGRMPNQSRSMVNSQASPHVGLVTEVRSDEVHQTGPDTEQDE